MKRKSRRRPHNRKKKIDRTARREKTLARMEKERGGPRKEQHLFPPISFDPFITFSSENQAARKAGQAVERLYEKLSIGKHWRCREKKLTALKTLCTNLILLEPFTEASARYRNILDIPLDKNKYWKDIRLKHLTDIPELTHELHEEGLIEMKPGYAYSKNNWKLTKIWPTPDFIKIIGRPLQMDNQTILYTGNLIELRDEDKNAIAYKDTAETRRIRKILERANRISRQYHIKYRIGPGMMGSLHTGLHAIFNQKLTWGGRLYTQHGDSYQSLSQKDRATIEIAGEPTIELDYSGLHPRLLYAEMGIQYDDKDPYKMIYDSDDKDLRKFLKIMLLAILNSKDRTTATKASNKTLKDKWDLCKAKRRTGKDTLFFLDRFEEAHAPIAHLFYTIRGRKLMNKDSKIALRIIDHFAKQDIPILTIHDSFIAPERFKDELRTIMAEAYKAETGGFTCPIDEK